MGCKPNSYNKRCLTVWVTTSDETFLFHTCYCINFLFDLFMKRFLGWACFLSLTKGKFLKGFK